MKTGKFLASLVLCLAVLGAGRFWPYTCGTLPGYVRDAEASWLGIVAAGLLLTIFLYVPIYDFISLLTHKLGWQESFNPIDVYPGEGRRPGQQPISQKTKRILYPLDLAVVIFFLLPLWTRVAYCD